ncbi:MAG TPA: hypothetical protein PLB53_07985, partial [Candidatus Atribacteria bacterium]|nr:hypothetical protein [Candidatus Atribacteria bacterium]
HSGVTDTEAFTPGYFSSFSFVFLCFHLFRGFIGGWRVDSPSPCLSPERKTAISLNRHRELE